MDRKAMYKLSYGFRPNRCAQQAIITALDMMNDGNDWMVDNDGKTRRGERRKRKQSGNGLFLIVLMILLAILTSCIRNMKAELEEMQIMLKRIEVLQYGNCVARSRKRWAFNEIEQQIKKIWTLRDVKGGKRIYIRNRKSFRFS